MPRSLNPHSIQVGNPAAGAASGIQQWTSHVTLYDTRKRIEPQACHVWALRDEMVGPFICCVLARPYRPKLFVHTGLSASRFADFYN